MKAKVIVPFTDLKAGCERERGDVFECSKERFAEINSAAAIPLAEEIPTAEEPSQATPKQRSRRAAKAKDE